MVAIALYFQIHQSLKIKNYRIFDIGHDEEYFDEESNKKHILNIARKCYIPTNNLLLELIKKHDKKFKITFSISGIALEQIEKYAPQVLESFKELVNTGCVEFLSETYYHSLSFLYSKEEFRRQIELHKQAIKKHFDFEPKIFRNTELIYNNELSNFIEELGYSGILSDGSQRILSNKNPNFIYSPKESNSKFILITKNNELSNDLVNKFSDKTWDDWPLTSEKFASWINSQKENSEIINLVMNYETFGEKHLEESQIFEFLKTLPDEILRNEENKFVTPTNIINSFKIKDKIDIPFLISQTSYSNLDNWIGNKMQKSAIDEIFALEKTVKNTKDKNLITKWREMTISNHFYLMNTNDVNMVNNVYNSPYDAYVYYMNALNDLIVRIKLKEKKEEIQKEILSNEKPKNILNKIKEAIKN
ncbi:MAG: glycoside hydrolase family 57 protein [Candidatus Woesearchaeota archaeon]|jgi:alpha-amylase|nr:glycoside hydrolase family 57 protein [Candidatus Woesearchaeota archaeon]